jgi:hypothetical protein
MNSQLNKILSALLILTGIWLVSAPLFFIDFRGSSAAYWNSILVGILIIFSASIREWVTQGDTRWASWVDVILGAWLIISSFVLGFASESGVFWNTIISGMVIVLIAAGSTTGIHVIPVARHKFN